MKYDEFTEGQLLLLNMAKRRQIPTELQAFIDDQGYPWINDNNIRTLLCEVFGIKFGIVYFYHLKMFGTYERERAERKVKKFMDAVTKIHVIPGIKRGSKEREDEKKNAPAG